MFQNAGQNTQHFNVKGEKKFQALLANLVSVLFLFLTKLVDENSDICAPLLLRLGQVPQAPHTRYGPGLTVAFTRIQQSIYVTELSDFV